MRLHVVLVMIALLGGCAGPGVRQADRYYILDAGPAHEGASRPRIGIDATPTTASSFYDTQDIVFSRSPGTRAYYQYNHWTERPQQAIHAQLVARLDNGNAQDATKETPGRACTQAFPNPIPVDRCTPGLTAS